MEDVSHLQFVAITFDDGSVGIMAFHLAPLFNQGKTDLPGFDKETGQREATDEAIQYEVDKSVYEHKPVSWRRVAYDDLVQDRTYRNALIDTGETLDHDMVKAREIHRDLLRVERTPELNDLDVAYVQADEVGDAATKASIASEKQVLRDVTVDPRIEEASTVEELKALTLDVLTAPEGATTKS